jgi:hypothetical protein
MTKMERLILYNQYKILEKLDSREGEAYARCATILERGYTREYSDLFDWMSEELDERVSEEVIEILSMFRALTDAYRNLADKSGMDERDINFRGFDGNDESKHFGYASFIIRDKAHFRESRNAGDDLNSHSGTLDRYRSMLRAWSASANQTSLTRDDVFRIVEAGARLADGKLLP